jgi:hypothetical protein
LEGAGGELELPEAEGGAGAFVEGAGSEAAAEAEAEEPGVELSFVSGEGVKEGGVDGHAECYIAM